MFDLGTQFAASVARDPDALALVDGTLRLTYAAWFQRISAVVAGLDAIGLKPGDRLVSVMQNRWEAATLHWACQFAGIVLVPINWRATAEEIGFALTDSGASAMARDAAAAPVATDLPCLLASGAGQGAAQGADAGASGPRCTSFEALIAAAAPPARPRADAEAISLMLYTSGTTARPKGVPRRHRAERAAAIAHVAQNQYARGERTLGVMPLYHTMGVRSLLAMAAIGGTFVCLPRFDPAAALALIETERLTALYLVPTLYHDLLHHAAFSPRNVASVRKLGFAGAAMTDGLLRALTAAFRPDLFVNHYGSSEIYTFAVEPDAAARPGSAGRAGINQMLRVVRLDGAGPDDLAAPGEEGEIIALAASDEAFEGYWNRPEATARALRGGWYFTGDTGHFDAAGDLFVTGRVDDMIITGGENVSPVEIERCLSLHPAVSEVAVVGLPDPRWGRVVAAFIRPAGPVGAAELDAHCRASALAAFKRPRRYVFVAEIPRSPVGKLLRRKLVAGDYAEIPAPPTQDTP